MAVRKGRTVRRGRQQDPGEAARDRARSRNRASGGAQGGQSGASSRAGSRGTSRQPLGVPEGYRAESQRNLRGMGARAAEGWAAQGAGHGAPFARPPRYFEGDEWRPASHGKDSIIAKQRALMLAGYLGADDEFSFGRWDETTREAYAELLAEANAAGLTADEMLLQAAESIQNPGAGGEGGGGGLRQGRGGEGGYTIDPITGELIPEPYVAPPLELKLPNRDEVRAAFRRGVVTELGQGWDASRIEAMVDAYINEVTRLQTEAYNQAVSYDRASWEGTLAPGGGGTITEVQLPSAESFLEDEMMRVAPGETQAGKIVNQAIPAFLQAIRGWAS